MMSIKDALNRVVNHLDLSTAEMQDVIRLIMTGQCSEGQIGAFLMGMRMKSESVEEIAGAVSVMRELATSVELTDKHRVVDIVGTGGDGANLFNVSTAAAFVISAAGARVAKHGNRAVSSRSGSADLLEAAGIYLDLQPQQVARCIETMGVGFMFAQAHHSAMRHAAGVRRDMGMRTLFNLVGPLTNPAGVEHHVIGVFTQELCHPVAEVLKRLGSRHALIVHSKDGLDEFSLASPSYVTELCDGEIRSYWLQPEEAGIDSQTLIGLSVNNTEESLTLVRDALGRRKTPEGRKAADMVALNAGAALYAADHADSLYHGVQLAQDALYSGLAWEKLQELTAFTAVFREESTR